MDLGPVDYSSATTPEGYRCTTCGASGCKLWREYQTAYTDLECCDCAGASQKKDVSRIDARGHYPVHTRRERRQIARSYTRGRRGAKRVPVMTTDAIGWRVPAVPAGPKGYWGYSAVPDDGIAWWQRLPTRPQVSP